VRSPLRFVTENWQLKLLALALAVLLWVVVSAEQVTSQWIPVPLQVNEGDPDFELLASPAREEVNVRFTGSGRDLMELAIRKPPLVLSIDRVQGVTQEFRLEPGMVQVPNQLTVNAQEVQSPLIRLEFRRLSSRTMPVRARVDNEVADDWALVDSLRVVPAEVQIRGPADRVELVQEVRTVPFTMPATDSSFSSVVAIDTSNLAGIELSIGQVRVVGRVDRVVQRRLVDVPISVGPGVVVRPNVVDVVLSGPRSIVETIQPSAFRVVISIPEVPDFIPLEGLSVPLRVEQLRTGVSASVVPPAVRLLPDDAPADTVGAAGAADGAGAGRTRG
jgi:YbbR domain-containing protein